MTAVSLPSEPSEPTCKTKRNSANFYQKTFFILAHSPSTTLKKTPHAR